ncbi:MAG: hypothetical protein Q4F95_00525 [Oscillospiraceae bacterium]|nr:hypothetical protein [Oscillospiraceae bacterium]
MSAAACIAVMAAAGGIISSLIKKDNIPIVPPVPSEQVTTVSKTDVSVTSSSLNAVTTYVTKSSDVSTAQAIVTSPPVSEAVTTAQESTSSVTESAVNYEDEYLKIFNSIAKPASETYIYLYGFGVQCDSFDGDVIFYDYYTHEIYFHGTGTEYQLNETELRNQYDNAVLAFKLTDPRFKSDTDFVNFIKTYFSDEIAGHCSKDFMYYDNSYYFIWPYGKGLEYDAWQTKDAVISDIVPDKSFVITAYFLDPRYRDEMDDSCKQRLTFVKTDAGWRISRVEDVVSGQVLFPRQ